MRRPPQERGVCRHRSQRPAVAVGLGQLQREREVERVAQLHHRRHGAQLGGDRTQRRLQPRQVELDRVHVRRGQELGVAHRRGQRPHAGVCEQGHRCERLHRDQPAVLVGVVDHSDRVGCERERRREPAQVRYVTSAGDRLLHHSRGQPPGAHRCTGAVWRLAEQVGQCRQHGQAPEVCRPRARPHHDRLVQAPQPVREPGLVQQFRPPARRQRVERVEAHHRLLHAARHEGKFERCPMGGCCGGERQNWYLTGGCRLGSPSTVANGGSTSRRTGHLPTCCEATNRSPHSRWHAAKEPAERAPC